MHLVDFLSHCSCVFLIHIYVLVVSSDPSDDSVLKHVLERAIGIPRTQGASDITGTSTSTGKVSQSSERKHLERREE